MPLRGLSQSGNGTAGAGKMEQQRFAWFDYIMPDLGYIMPDLGYIMPDLGYNVSDLRVWCGKIGSPGRIERAASLWRTTLKVARWCKYISG